MTPAPTPRTRLAPRPVEFHGYFVEALLRPGSPHKARVLLAYRGGQRVVIKDLSPMRPLLKALFGRRMLRREARALEYLEGFEFTTRLVERISADAIAIEFVNSIYLRKSLAPRRKPAALRSLVAAVQGLHERGVVHFDLRQRKNILVRRDDQVMLIDFESCFVFGRSPLGRFFTRIFSSIDRQAVLKWQAKFLPKMLSKDEASRHQRFQRLRRLWFFKSALRWLRSPFTGTKRRTRRASGQGGVETQANPDPAQDFPA
jgi:predicted Ser/Thr protein kinase